MLSLYAIKTFPLSRATVLSSYTYVIPALNVVSDVLTTKLDDISRPKLPVIAVIERFLTSSSSKISFTGIPAEFIKL